MQIGVDRAGQVSRRIGLAPRIGPAQVVAAVEEHRPGAHGGQGLHIDQGGERRHRSSLSRCRRDRIRYNRSMALTFYWGSGSPYSWRVHLALEHKQLAYESHLLHFDKQEHQSPQM